MIDVIIPAAGKGVRFHELGRQYPKCILPYNGKPIIVHNLKLLLNIEQLGTITIIVDHQSQKIIDTITMYFKNKVDSRIIQFKTYSTVNGNYGPLVSIYHGLNSSRNSLLVVLSDILLQTYFDFKSSFISVQKVDDYKRWCMVEQNKQILRFYDKVKQKPPTNLSLSGIYYFEDGNTIYNIINKIIKPFFGELQISKILEIYLKTNSLKLKPIAIIDFGTLEEYQGTRLGMNCRFFNILEDKDYMIIKKSHEYRAKIIKEVNWFKTMPPNIQQHLPRIYDDNIKAIKSNYTWYSIEKINYPTLREWYLFLEADIQFWDNVFNKIFLVLDKFYNTNNLGNSFFNEMIIKTTLRIAGLPSDYKPDSFLSIFKNLKFNTKDTIFHGDMNFSNIFFDEKSENVMLIDPNGDVQGNVLYDYAKLMTSVIYDYDFIDSNLYMEMDGDYTLFNAGKKQIKDLFMEKLKKRFDANIIRTITLISASLFLTMIPLHKDNKIKQKLFYQCYKKAVDDAAI